MRVGSVCSGIEAASVAWAPLGWRPQWFAEIDPFASAVLAHRFPSVPNHGDMTRIPDDAAAIDILVGGTPCQSFSVAGLRGGMGDDRGNLALEYCRLAGRLRPRWVVWENVTGVLSADEGRAFGSIVGALVELGYSCAWRVLDAQYVRVDGYPRAVPQRRRRVFLVGHLGGSRTSGAAVLFDRRCLLRHSPPRRGPGTEVAGTLTASLGRRCGVPDGGDTPGQLIPFNPGTVAAPHGDSPQPGDPCPTLNASHEQLAVAFQHQASMTQPMSLGPFSPTLGTTKTPAVFDRWGVRRLLPVECERLQGVPDGWTQVPYRGKPACDSPRYRALGNSMAVNCMRWIGRRIAMVDSLLHPGDTP